MSPEDRLLGDLLIAQGIVSRERVEECASFLSRLTAEGVTPVPALGEILVRKGYLTTRGLQATIRQTSAPARSRPEELPPEAARAAEDPSRVQGKYVQVARLGAGGMGEVWKAWDRVLARWVALKILKVEDPADVARFHREAETAARLSHPNIAAVYEIGETNGTPMIAMELVAGTTLSDVPPKDLRALADLVCAAARAVHYAHEQGVIHRDLKPSNIMVGPSGRVYVMDFGLAKQTSLDSSITVSGAILGTPAFMPPEQARGQTGRIDARSDVYSLGATLYELLARRPVFGGKDVLAILRQVVEQAPEPLRRKNPRVDRDLETIVLKCLEKDPARRYATALELAEDLERYLNREPILAHPPSPVYRAWRILARHKAVVLPTAAAVLLGLSLAVTAAAGAIFTGRRIREFRAEGAAREKAGDWEKARDAYRSALDLGSDPEAASGLERASREVRKIAESKEAARRAAEARKAAHEEATKLLEAGRPALDQAAQYLYSRDAEYEELVRRVEVGQKHIEEAILKAPDLALGHHLLGRAWEIRGWDDRAEAGWRKALELDPAFGPAHYHLGRLLLRRAILAKQRIADSLSGMSPRETERLAAEAEKAFEASRKFAGFGDEVQRELAPAMIAYARRDFAALESVARRAIERFRSQEGVEEFHWLLGVATNDLKLRLEAFEAALAIRPKYPEALQGRAFHRYSRGDLTGALADMTEALRISPRQTGLYVTRGAIRSARGEVDGAISDFGEALKLDPRSVHAYNNRGNARLRKGETEGALSDFNEALKIDPAFAYAIDGRARLKLLKGDAEGAIADFTEALRLGADPATTFNNRGLARYQKGDVDGAIDDLSESLKRNARAPGTFLFRARARQRKRDFAGARADYDAALRLRPDDPAVHAERGHLCRNAGDVAAALESFRKALDVAPAAWSQRRAVQAQIEELEKRP